MSTINLATLQSNTALPPTIQNSSAVEIGTFCRAWVNFNGTGTVAIRASFNVSSITDNGVGLYTVNFASSFPDANYSIVATQGPISYAGQSAAISGTPIAASAQLGVTGLSAGSAISADAATVNVSVFR
jgi:hypothetical protein